MTRQRRRLVHLVWPLLLALGLLLADVASAHAATIVVNSSGEDFLQNGQCTLVEALNNANNNTLYHPDCLVAGEGGGIIDRVEIRIPTSTDPNFGCNLTTRVCTIAMSGTYSIIDPVTVDGYTQGVASPNTLDVGDNAVLRTRLLPKPGFTGLSALLVRANDVTIRGLSIGGFPRWAIQVDSGARSRIVGNFLGLDPDGTTSNQNGWAGIQVNGPATELTIGGTNPADRNVISGNNGGNGISLFDVSLGTVQGNYIGTNAAGTASLSNATGIDAHNAQAITIGGTAAGARNVISGNLASGVRFTTTSISTNYSSPLQGNYVGVNASGTAGIPNRIGVYIISSGNLVGGTMPGEGNFIAFNSQSGVRVENGIGNRILGNRISSNGGLGIDLVGGIENAAGVTQTDFRDADSGANNLQNTPDVNIVGARVNTTVHGFLHSTVDRTFRIEFFWSTNCDPSGYGEADTFLGAVTTRTDFNGSAHFVGTFPFTVGPGFFITATATDEATGDTSELSLCRQSFQAAINVSSTGLRTTEANEGGAQDAAFNVGLTTLPTANVTIPISVSDPTEGAIVGGVSSLTFTPTDEVPVRSVSLLGVDDALDDGDVPYAVVIGPASSADPNYNGLDPPDVPVINVDDESCTPRPRVAVSVTRVGPGLLRANVSVTAGTGTNELQAITWNRLQNATVTVDGGAVQAGQRTAFPSLTQGTSFLISRTPGAQSATVHFTVTDICGTWPSFVGGGPNAW